MKPSERVELEAEVTVVRAMERIAMAMDELEVTNTLYDAYRKVINSIPECSVHGSDCLPHAQNWIDHHILMDERAARG